MFGDLKLMGEMDNLSSRLRIPHHLNKHIEISQLVGTIPSKLTLVVILLLVTELKLCQRVYSYARIQYALVSANPDELRLNVLSR